MGHDEGCSGVKPRRRWEERFAPQFGRSRHREAMPKDNLDNDGQDRCQIPISCGLTFGPVGRHSRFCGGKRHHDKNINLIECILDLLAIFGSGSVEVAECSCLLAQPGDLLPQLPVLGREALHCSCGQGVSLVTNLMRVESLGGCWTWTRLVSTERRVLTEGFSVALLDMKLPDHVELQVLDVPPDRVSQARHHILQKNLRRGSQIRL